MCAWKQFSSLRKLKLRHFSLQGRFDMLLSWCVVNNFSLCFLTSEHNSNYFQSLAFSHPPFTSSESVHSGSATGPARLCCLTTPIFQCDCPSHSSCGEQVNSLMVLEFSSQRWKIWTLTRANAYFSSLQQLHGGTGTELKISGRGKKKDMWQSARWAIYEIDSGHSILGRKWKNPNYGIFRLSLEVDSVPVSSQEADTGRSQIRKYIDRWVKQEEWRKTNRGASHRVKGWLPLGSPLHHTVGLV